MENETIENFINAKAERLSVLIDLQVIVREVVQSAITEDRNKILSELEALKLIYKDMPHEYAIEQAIKIIKQGCDQR